MRIEYGNIKKNVPDEIINRIISGLQVSKDEAIKIYLEDESVIINEEQEQLNKKAEQSGVMRMIHGATSEKVVQKRMAGTTEKKRTTKPQPDKEAIINYIRVLFEGFELRGDMENVTVENPTKTITFNYHGAPYKLDLTATRVKKSG
jgi:hypothetical protein